MKHFMAVMGTNLYEPVVYYERDSGFESSEQEFIQLALIEKYREELTAAGAKITLFVTKDADVKNIQDRDYASYEEKSAANRWKSERKHDVKAGAPKKGFRSQFDTLFPELKEHLKIVPIADAQTEDQIWDVFNSIFEELCEGDEIIFDITHSFRSIPMLAMTVINYAKVLKNCTLESICYGAYEAVVVENGIQKAPVNNLTMYDEILSWTNAANVFMRYGNASMMKEIFTQRFRTIPNSEKKYWSGIRSVIDDAENLSDTIQTSRGVDADGELFKGRRDKDRAKISVKSAYRVFAENLKKVEDEKIREMQPLVPLLEKVQEEFSVFDCSENYEVGMAVVNWSIDNGLVQQGYTALEETIKTYICHRYGMDELNEDVRDGLAGTAAIWLAKAAMNKTASLSTPDERLAFCMDKLNHNEDISERLVSEPQQKEAFLQFFRDDNIELSILLFNIKDKRNDINHFGMRDHPIGAADLKKYLKQDYESFEAIVR